MAYRTRSTTRRAPARRARTGSSRTRYSQPRRKSVRRGSSRSAPKPQIIKLVIETAPTNPVSRMSDVLAARAAPSKAKAKF